ncbi:hypothetical protein TYRP_021224 [Tyrophagus putrescentiae]|nr:hypothetical protein TYRP_021224 [Tyrophagus putrescentiae]
MKPAKKAVSDQDQQLLTRPMSEQRLKVDCSINRKNGQPEDGFCQRLQIKNGIHQKDVNVAKNKGGAVENKEQQEKEPIRASVKGENHNNNNNSKTPNTFAPNAQRVAGHLQVAHSTAGGGIARPQEGGKGGDNGGDGQRVAGVNLPPHRPRKGLVVGHLWTARQKSPSVKVARLQVERQYRTVEGSPGDQQQRNEESQVPLWKRRRSTFLKFTV